MSRKIRRILRRICAYGAVGALAALAFAEGACILAQPSEELQGMADSRPTIVHASVVPSTSAILTRFPSVFIVPVELSDPTSTFYYAAFIDYDPATGVGLVSGVEPSVFEVANTTGRTRILNIAIPEPAPDRCHVIEVVVALQNLSYSINTHAPDERGGDLVTWFYNPGGDPAGCPALDAGIDSPFDGADGDGDGDGGAR